MTKRTPFDKADAYFTRITEGRPVWRGAYLTAYLIGVLALIAGHIWIFWTAATDLEEIGASFSGPALYWEIAAYWPMWAYVGGMFVCALIRDYFTD